jgi:hypothetical protein
MLYRIPVRWAARAAVPVSFNRSRIALFRWRSLVPPVDVPWLLYTSPD